MTGIEFAINKADIDALGREFGRIVKHDMPKAKAWVEVRGWKDPTPALLRLVSQRTGVQSHQLV